MLRLVGFLLRKKTRGFKKDFLFLPTPEVEVSDRYISPFCVVNWWEKTRTMFSCFAMRDLSFSTGGLFFPFAKNRLPVVFLFP